MNIKSRRCYNLDMSTFPLEWLQLSTTTSARFICGYCGQSISSDKAYIARDRNTHTPTPSIYICHSCNKPTFIDGSEVVPGVAMGNSVKHLPDDINDIYEEVRRATSVNSHTAAVLAARKLLMHIAVEKGAQTGKTFQHYVNYLDTNHYTPPNSVSWVDSIRQLGNEANHEIVIMSSDQSGLILTFLEMLLKFIYEFPAPVVVVESSEISNGTPE